MLYKNKHKISAWSDTSRHKWKIYLKCFAVHHLQTSQLELHTSNCREAGEGGGACNVHTGHIGAAGIQTCEAVMVAGGSVHAESAVGALLRVVHGRGVAAADGWAFHRPGHQQCGRSPVLETDRETPGVAWDEANRSFSHRDRKQILIHD